MTALWDACLSDAARKETLVDNLRINLTVLVGDLDSAKAKDRADEKLMQELRDSNKGNFRNDSIT